MKDDRIKIYDEYETAFRHVSAYVILYKCERIGKIAFKRATSGLRTTCYLQWFGVRMVKGVANGGGYDKSTASAAAAARAMAMPPPDGKDAQEMRDFLLALREDGGWSWDRCLEEAGFNVLQAV